MQRLLLSSLESLSGDQLDELFAQVFNLEPLHYSSGAYTAFLMSYLLDHAIRVELDRTTTKGCAEIDVNLTPRATRTKFEDLRAAYFHGLSMDYDTARPALFRLKTVTRRGKTLDATLMRALLELAYRDVFFEL